MRLDRGFWRRLAGWPEGVVFLAFVALYASTLAPSVLPADSGEFQLVSAVLGIAHPPGYPLYTLLGHLAAQVPLGEVAARVNALSALCGALTVAVVARSVRRGTQSRAAALLSASALGLSATFWAQSTTANIRSLTALLTALSVESLLCWGAGFTGAESARRIQVQAPTGLEDSLRSGPGAQQAVPLRWFAFLFGLSVGHHSSLLLLGAPFLAYILLCDARLLVQPRRWGRPLLAFGAALGVLLYLPLRSLAGAPFDPAPIRSLQGFWEHVLALGFRGDFLYFRAPSELALRAGVGAQILRLQWGHALPWVMLLGAGVLARREWRTLALLAGVAAVNTLAALTYRAPQTIEYLLPTYVALALLFGHGLGEALGWLRACSPSLRLGHASRRLALHLPVALLALLAFLVAQVGWANYPSLAALHRDTTTRDDAVAMLREAPPQALLLSSWHRATPFWYLQSVEGLRPDVRVEYVYPEGATPNEQVWLRRVGAGLAERPVIVTNYFAAYAASPYRWVPFHQGWLAQREPLRALPEHLTPRAADFGEGIRILGYRLETTELAPGETARLTLAWTTDRPLARDTSTFAQLLGPTGVVGQRDLVQRAGEVLPGEVRVDAYDLPVLLHAAPGEYTLITGFYFTTPGGWQRLRTGGADHLALATLLLRPATTPATTLHPLNVRYANGLRLQGVDYDQTLPGQTRLYLHGWATTATSGGMIRLRQGEAILAQAHLPALPPNTGTTVALDVPAGVESVAVEVVDGDDERVRRRGSLWRWTTATWPLHLPREGAHFIPLGREMAYLGLAQPLPAALAVGSALTLTPRWLALRPLNADYAVSVGLERRDPAWQRKADGVPALGAIPTLKWLRGWQIEDAHPLAVPSDAPRGAATLTLAVYDAFTGAPLPVLDERLVAQGQGITLELGTVRLE
jgi:hypothetical protein